MHKLCRTASSQIHQIEALSILGEQRDHAAALAIDSKQANNETEDEAMIIM
jgi:hypothetical protein